MSAKQPIFAFFGTSIDSRFALSELERRGLLPAVVIDNTRDLPPEFYNTEWDFFVVASYGKRLRKEVLALPKHGCLNIHPSLLPKYRGPSPYVSAILADDRATGVSAMLLEEKMDAGPVLASARIEIDEAEWPPKGLVLSQMLFTEGAALVAEALPLWLRGELTPVPQDETAATYTRKFADSDALLDLAGDARQNFLKIRAFDRSPRAHFIDARGRRIVVTEATFDNGALVIERVIPEGKKEMSYQEYLRGMRP